MFAKLVLWVRLLVNYSTKLALSQTKDCFVNNSLGAKLVRLKNSFFESSSSCAKKKQRFVSNPVSTTLVWPYVILSYSFKKHWRLRNLTMKKLPNPNHALIPNVSSVCYLLFCFYKLFYFYSGTSKSLWRVLYASEITEILWSTSDRFEICFDMKT